MHNILGSVTLIVFHDARTGHGFPLITTNKPITVGFVSMAVFPSTRSKHAFLLIKTTKKAYQRGFRQLYFQP
jgi:hypothetical protein